MEDNDFEEAFQNYWEGDEGDEPITDIAKDRVREIFLSGYLFGRRKPVYQMSAIQYQSLVRAVEEKIKKEKADEPTTQT